MKKSLFVSVAACLIMPVLSAQAQYRDFTDTTGRHIKARLIRYDSIKNKVTVDCEGKGTKTVPITIFSEADQKYILSWSKNQEFLDERRVIVDFTRRKEKNTEHTEEVGNMSNKYFDCGFTIELENRSKVDFRDITLEYVIYYTQDKHTNNRMDKTEQEGRLYAKQTIDLPEKETREITTQQVLLHTYRESGYSVTWPDIYSEMHGIILQLSIRSDTGETVTRRIKYPDNLKYSWNPSSEDVQARP